MKLSDEQVKLFWREWPKSCAAMGWTKARGLSAKEIDAKRKEFLLGCGFDSLTQVDRVAGFTKVKNELLVLQGVSIKAAQETIDPTLNDGRTLRHFILTDQVPCLELYLDDVRGYMTSIMEDKNRWWKIDRPARDITLMDLDAKPVHRWCVKTKQMRDFPSQLEQIKWTLAARINTLRNAAGETIHQMRTRAKLPCACAVCQGRRVAVSGVDPELEISALADPELGTGMPEEAECPF